MFDKDKNSDFNRTIWEKDILPKFINTFNECKDSLVDENILNEFREKTKDLEIKENEYNQSTSSFIYFISNLCLFLSVLALFIPWYWSYKWYKELKNKRDVLSQSIEKSQYDKLSVQRQLAVNIDYLKFFNNFNSVIKYQNMGPINEMLVESLKELSFDDITNDDDSNFYTSSWGVYDNKIVVHKAKQELNGFIKTYTGSKTVYVRRVGSDGKTYTESHVVTATYDHIAYSIDYYKTSYAFMESCSSLEFNLDSINESKRSNKRFDKSNEKHYSPMENQEFEDKFNWHRNNEIQFRMFFTPLAQENYVNEYNAIVNKGEDPSYLNWTKNTSFVFNEHEAFLGKFVWFNIFEINIYEFVTNFKMSYEEFLNNLFKSIIKYYYDIYKSIPYMFLTTLMNSEDHTNIIKRIKDKKNKELSYIELMMFFHNLLNERFGQKIIVRDTDCFNKLIDVIPIWKSVNNNLLYKAEILGTSFIINRLVTYVEEFGPNGYESVPVYYDDYVEENAMLYSFAGYISNDYIYNKLEKSGIFTDIKDNEILDLISIIEQHNFTIVIKNKILSIFSYYEENTIDQENIINLFNKLNSK